MWWVARVLSCLVRLVFSGVLVRWVLLFIVSWKSLVVLKLVLG